MAAEISTQLPGGGTRLLKLSAPAPNKPQVHFTLIRLLAKMDTSEEVIVKANQAIRGPEAYESGRYDERRKNLLVQLEESLISLRKPS